MSQEIEQQGADAFVAGVSREANPYQFREQMLQWDNGWLDAYYANSPTWGSGYDLVDFNKQNRIAKAQG